MKIVGHRGARGLAPENTIDSIKSALKNNVDEVEIDARITKDGVVILSHDPYIREAAKEKLQVSQHKFSQLKQHKPNLATLEEAIVIVSSSVPLNIEVKPGEPIKPISNLIKKYLKKGWHTDSFLFSSRQYKILKQLHRELPQIQIAVIDRWSGLRATRRAREFGTKRISMKQLFLWSGFISAMSKNGYELYAYPLNDPRKAKRWGSHGLRGVITDHPERFKKIRS